MSHESRVAAGHFAGLPPLTQRSLAPQAALPAPRPVPVAGLMAGLVGTRGCRTGGREGTRVTSVVSARVQARRNAAGPPPPQGPAANDK